MKFRVVLIESWKEKDHPLERVVDAGDGGYPQVNDEGVLTIRDQKDRVAFMAANGEWKFIHVIEE